MKFSITKTHVIILIIVCILGWLIFNFMPMPMKLGNLSKSQLQNMVVNREIVEASTGSAKRYYTIKYNADGSFLVDYNNNNQKIGDIKGTYEMISKLGKGYIKLHAKSVNIPDSHQHVGILNSDHPNSISDGKDHKWTLGPFKVVNENNNVTVLSYFCERDNKTRIMNVYQ